MDRAILDQITASWPHGMIVLDAKSRVVYWNHWMERTSTITSEAATGHGLADVFDDGKVAPRLIAAIESALANGTSSILTRSFTPYALPLHRDHHDATLMVQSIRVRSIRSGDGDRYCMLDVHDETASAKRDTQLISQQRCLREQKEALMLANEALDAFVHHAGHDLRAPLRGIEAFLVLLRTDLGQSLPADANEDLENIESCAAQLGTIIEDLLIISRTTHKMLDIDDVDMERCLDMAIESVSACLVDADFEVQRAPWPKVRGDRRMLEQLVHNLVENALQHRPEGGGKPLLQFTLDESQGRPIFGLKDNGPGIPEQDQESMWTPFKSYSSFHEGSGLGLAICRCVVERHNGQLWCESVSGNGAHFQFSL